MTISRWILRMGAGSVGKARQEGTAAEVVSWPPVPGPVPRTPAAVPAVKARRQEGTVPTTWEEVKARHRRDEFREATRKACAILDLLGYQETGKLEGVVEIIVGSTP